MDVKSLTLEGLEYFKTKQDAFNDEKFATKVSVPTKMSQLQNDSAYQTKSEMDTAISAAVSSALASVMTYKGTKETVGELPVEGNKLGDVWHVTADAAEYAWDGTKWEALGSTMGIAVDWGSITGKPSEFNPAPHVHDAATTDADGFMSSSDKTKLDGLNNYTHPTSPAGAKAAGIYKVATDANGHVTEATAVVKGDIDALGVISVPEGGSEGQFVQSKSGSPTWADGMYVTDGKIMSGVAEVASVSVNAGGFKVEMMAGEDSAIQITDAEGKVLPIGITGGESAVGLGQSPIDYIYVKDIADIAGVDGKLVPNAGSIKKYVDSKTIVDDTLSDASVNPVQNKVITTELDKYASKYRPDLQGGVSLDRGGGTPAKLSIDFDVIAEPYFQAEKNGESTSCVYFGESDIRFNKPLKFVQDNGISDSAEVKSQTRQNLGAAAISHTHGIGDVEGVSVSADEINYLDGVTSNVQSQLDAKAASEHEHSADDITSGMLPIERGGTGASTATDALESLGAASQETIDRFGEVLWNGSITKGGTLTIPDANRYGIMAVSYSSHAPVGLAMHFVNTSGNHDICGIAGSAMAGGLAVRGFNLRSDDGITWTLRDAVILGLWGSAGGSDIGGQWSDSAQVQTLTIWGIVPSPITQRVISSQQ